METNWIVVAEAARARIFERIGRNGNLEELYELTHPETRAHHGDLRTGGKGEVIESTGASTHQADPQVTTTEKHAEFFAKELTEFLQKRRAVHEYNNLMVVAEPRFLGRIRDNLDGTTAKLVEMEIDKNWTQHDSHQIGQLLEKQA